MKENAKLSVKDALYEAPGPKTRRLTAIATTITLMTIDSSGRSMNLLMFISLSYYFFLR